ncbi:MAG: PD-(D/E)XK nuclease family protein, partial [Sphaerochaetaceae bacterium]
EADIYSFCVNQLEVLDRAMKEAGYDSFDNLYALYYGMLETTGYVEQVKQKGIKVFNYPVTLGIRPKYHFILGVNQDAIKQHNQYISFLSQEMLSSLEQLEEAPLLFKKKDFTDRVLSYYSFSGEQVFLSYAKKTFSSSVICPSLFQEEGLKIDFNEKGEFGFENDKDQKEKAFWAEGKPFVPNVRQSEGFQSFSLLNFGEKKKNNFSWLDEVKGLKTEEGKWKLSSTEINAFRDCPFKWVCKYSYRTSDDDFNILDEDYAEMGNFYHRVFESFFEEIKVFQIDKIESYRQILNDIYLKELKYYEDRVKIPESTLTYEKGNFNSIMENFLESKDVSTWEDKEFKGKEVGKTIINDNWTLNGKIDLILSNENGDLGVIDFKSSDSSIKKTKLEDIKESSVQLLVYNRLMEKDLEFAAFYVVKDHKFKYCFSNPNEAKISRQILENIIKAMIDNIEKGELEPVISEKGCKDCIYKKVCRKKFVIR